MSFTVLVENTCLGRSHFVGTFETEEEAASYAEDQANRTRKFMQYEVYSGTPRGRNQPTNGKKFLGTK